MCANRERKDFELEVENGGNGMGVRGRRKGEEETRETAGSAGGRGDIWGG